MTSWKKQKTLCLTLPPVNTHILQCVLVRSQKKLQLKNACFFKIREVLELALLVVLMFLLHVRLKKAERKQHNSKINSAKEESPDSNFHEKQLATAEEQEMVDLNDINDPNINFHYSLPSTSQMRTRLPATATVCDRYYVSDRAATDITPAVLQDFGIISEADTSHVVDKNKMRNVRLLKISEFQLHSNEKCHTARDDSIAIFFDSRTDKALYQIKKGNKFYPKEIVEEHLSIVREPCSQYFDHVTPTSGSAFRISKYIINCLMKKKVDAKNITTVVCDGTVVNTGQKSVFIRRSEKGGRFCNFSQRFYSTSAAEHVGGRETTNSRTCCSLTYQGKRIFFHSLTSQLCRSQTKL
ncbi:hypothetical protein AVEN_132284-1 [Araneus ventricosus]|uniref:Uncharacterized protein n=1 Tax=Araneus ventricosus TaxID=182803 RepID=A0A4Y2LDR4_ARAVE|nr:hypothetical protein AVEN_132284-1 [Araneus ventricosus]